MNSRIENAGCVSCFLDPTKDFEPIKKRLTSFQTNLILCDSEHFNAINADKEQLTQVFRCSLFDADCALVRVEDLMCRNNSPLTKIGCGDKTKSSNICFYASTSGSCGEVKPIGVTYKCFWPNIQSLG